MHLPQVAVLFIIFIQNDINLFTVEKNGYAITVFGVVGYRTRVDLLEGAVHYK